MISRVDRGLRCVLGQWAFQDLSRHPVRRACYPCWRRPPRTPQPEAFIQTPLPSGSRTLGCPHPFPPEPSGGQGRQPSTRHPSGPIPCPKECPVRVFVCVRISSLHPPSWSSTNVGGTPALKRATSVGGRRRTPWPAAAQRRTATRSTGAGSGWACRQREHDRQRRHKAP